MLETPRLPEGVGQTAFGVARARVAESRRADRLFEDPLAEAFARAGAAAGFGESPAAPEGSTQGFDVRAMLGAYVAIRTRCCRRRKPASARW